MNYFLCRGSEQICHDFFLLSLSFLNYLRIFVVLCLDFAMIDSKGLVLDFNNSYRGWKLGERKGENVDRYWRAMGLLFSAK